MEKTSKSFLISAVLLGILAIAGIAAWIYQLMGGLGVTGMNNGTSWGLYIACFMFFVGLSAGGLIVASAASVFGVVDYKKVALPAVILSTVCICLAAIFVLIDMGSVQRVFNLIISPNITSPLFWDVCIITIYLIINIIYLVLMLPKKEGVDNSRKLNIVSRFALPAAILVHSVTAWIFGLEIAREGWYSAIMAPLFVVSAMDSGLALLLLALAGLKKAKVFSIEQSLMGKLAGLLVTCMAIDAFLVGCELLTMAYPGAAGAEILAIMTTGATAPFFWIEVVLGLVIPFMILVFKKARESNALILLASCCVVVGVFCKRIWLLLSSFVEFNVQGAPGVISGSSATAHLSGVEAWTTVSAYAPTWVELVIMVGVIALGALAFIVMSRFMLSPKAATKSTDTVKGEVAAQTA